MIKSVRFSMSAWLQQEAGPTSSAEAKKSEPRGQEKKCCKYRTCLHIPHVVLNPSLNQSKVVSWLGWSIFLVLVEFERYFLADENVSHITALSLAQ